MSLFTGKTLMITGGTGSFGNAVLNRFLQTDIGEIRIFSRDEKKQDDMRHEYQARYPEASKKIKFYIGDVRDLQSVQSAMHRVDYIFHAAALKQVPSCEFFPMEAVKTNVLGTENLLTAAIDEGVRSVICLSTDKAAYPVNAMGMSKALMEKVALAIGLETDNPNQWLQACSYYDAYGTDKQLDDPVKGVAFFAAFDTVLSTETEPKFNTVEYDGRVIMPRGLKYKFVPEKSGAYIICSQSTD